MSWRIDRVIQEMGNLKMYRNLGRGKLFEKHSNLFASDPVDSSDFQNVRLRQNTIHDPRHWYCRLCRCDASQCSVLSLPHDLVSMPEEARDGKYDTGEALEDRRADDLDDWSSDAFFEAFDVEWTPEVPAQGATLKPSL